VLNNPLANREKVFFPTLHIKLGLMKNLVKTMDRNGAVFMYLKPKFPRLNDAKIKKGIFTGPKIRELMKDEQFAEQLNKVGKTAWQAFKKCYEELFGKPQGRKLS
jgi:hypothetical protein